MNHTMHSLPIRRTDLAVCAAAFSAILVFSAVAGAAPARHIRHRARHSTRVSSGLATSGQTPAGTSVKPKGNQTHKATTAPSHSGAARTSTKPR